MENLKVQADAVCWAASRRRCMLPARAPARSGASCSAPASARACLVRIPPCMCRNIQTAEALWSLPWYMCVLCACLHVNAEWPDVFWAFMLAACLNALLLCHRYACIVGCS